MRRAPSIIVLTLSLGCITGLFATPYDREIAAAAGRVGLSAHLVHAVVKTESAYRKSARSRAGAVGLMQLMPATAKRFGVTNRKDPAQNLRGGTVYLAWLLRRYKGNLQFALAGYNAGEGAVDKYNGIPPYRETKQYVVKVLKELKRRQENRQPSAVSPNIVRVNNWQDGAANHAVRVTTLQAGAGITDKNNHFSKQFPEKNKRSVVQRQPAPDEYTVRYAYLTATQTQAKPVAFSFFGVN